MQAEANILERIARAYVAYRGVRLACALGIVSAALLLFLLAGGFPPFAWRLLARALPQLPALEAAHGQAALLAMFGLVPLSITILLAWGALLWLSWKMLAYWLYERRELRSFAADAAQAHELAEHQEITYAARYPEENTFEEDEEADFNDYTKNYYAENDEDLNDYEEDEDELSAYQDEEENEDVDEDFWKTVSLPSPAARARGTAIFMNEDEISGHATAPQTRTTALADGRNVPVHGAPALASGTNPPRIMEGNMAPPPAVRARGTATFTNSGRASAPSAASSRITEGDVAPAHAPGAHPTRILEGARTQPSTGLFARVPLPDTDPVPNTPEPAANYSTLQLIVSTGLDVGLTRRGRPNEDNLLALQNTRMLRDSPCPVGLFVIADGMGGHENGQEASRLVIQSLSRTVVPSIIYGPTDDNYAELLAEGVHHANLEVYRRNRERQVDMGTTIAAALVVGTTAYVVNAGDSRVYLYRASSGLSQVTRDHSTVARLLEKGLIQPDDVYTHPRRNEIYRSLGHHPSAEMDSSILALQPDDLLLLCSDGLWEMVRDAEIQRIIASTLQQPTRISAALVQAALEGGGRDNISVIAVYIKAVQEAQRIQAAWAS